MRICANPRLAAEQKREIDTTLAMLKAMSDALAAVLPTGSDEQPTGALVSTGESPLLAAFETRLSVREGKQESRFVAIAEPRQPQMSMYR